MKESLNPKKFRSQNSTKKVLVSVFWNSHDVIHIYYLDKRKTITRDYYLVLSDCA